MNIFKSSLQRKKEADAISRQLFIRYMKSHFLATGSQVFGVATEGSDFDFVATGSQLDSAINELGIKKFFRFLLPEGYAEEYADSGSDIKSYKFKSDCGKVFNLIVVPSEMDLEAWKYATLRMSVYPPVWISEKKVRTREFGYLLTQRYQQLNEVFDSVESKARYSKAVCTWGEMEEGKK